MQKFILRYVLAHPVVKTVIIGITKSDYLDEIIEASSMPLSLIEFNKINEVLSL
jgi:aryl-alcohol dehydrogenase-like predicted oxidoreductase